jgi:hypothetical protein
MGNTRKMLDERAREDYLSSRISQAPRQLQDQIAQANQEAQETFDGSFKGKERRAKAPTVCETPQWGDDPSALLRQGLSYPTISIPLYGEEGQRRRER